MNPIFALGKENIRQIASALEAEIRIIPVADADSYFSAGEALFIAEYDSQADEYSAIECLGIIQAVSADSVTCAYPLAAEKTAEARVWKPVHTLEWDFPPHLPHRIENDRGVENITAADGTLYRYKIRGETTDIILAFSNLPEETYAAYQAWFDSVTGGGISAFTWVDSFRTVSAVRLLEKGIPAHSEIKNRYSLGIRLRLEAEHSYV